MMAYEEGSNRRCFTFLWKLENVSYCLPNAAGIVESPTFVVNEIHETNWKLELYISNDVRDGYVEMYLQRHEENEHAEDVEIDCEFAFLSFDGRVLHSLERKNSEISRNGFLGAFDFVSRNELFFERRSMFLPQDTLTARCRMWKSVGEMSKDMECYARTRIAVEKRSFLWSIENFSTLKSDEEKTHEITSLGSGKELMSLKLLIPGGLICDELIRVKIIPNFGNIKNCTFKLSILDASKNTVKCFQDEFWHADVCESKDYYESKEFILLYTKRELLENKSAYLQNDVLSLWCECAFSCGIVLEEIEMAISDRIAVAKEELDNHSLETKNKFPVPCCILIDNLKSMLNNSSLSDIKLRTKRQTYDAHTFILGARSPVFKAMFSNDMKEKINECVNIEDLNDDTVLRMLHYIYSAEVEELEWASATELYEAADKYQILNLKDICSSYLKSKLCVNNSCEALVLADLHQDEDLKRFVQDFILRHGKDIINSEEWEQLMETNVNLAAETMRLKFKE